MQRILRVVALANAGYLGLVGVLGMLSPGLIAALFHIGVPDPTEVGLIRILCGLLCTNAAMLVMLARQDEHVRILARLALVSAGFNLFADLAACLNGDLSWSTLTLGMIGQVALVAAIAVWMRLEQGVRAKA